MIKIMFGIRHYVGAVLLKVKIKVIVQQELDIWHKLKCISPLFDVIWFVYLIFNYFAN